MSVAGQRCADRRGGLGGVGAFVGASHTTTRHHFVKIRGSNLHDSANLRISLTQVAVVCMVRVAQPHLMVSRFRLSWPRVG